MFHSFHHTFTTTSREEKHIYPLLLSTHTNTSILYTHSINLNIEQAGRSKLTPARYQPSPSLASTTCTPKKHKIRICDCELPLSTTAAQATTKIRYTHKPQSAESNAPTPIPFGQDRNNKFVVQQSTSTFWIQLALCFRIAFDSIGLILLKDKLSRCRCYDYPFSLKSGYPTLQLLHNHTDGEIVSWS